MSFLSLNFPLNFPLSFPLLRIGDAHALRWRDLTPVSPIIVDGNTGAVHSPLAQIVHAWGADACPLARLPRRPASIDECAAAVFVDVDVYDFVERVFSLEAELARAARLDALRPARDDARDQRILGAANARGNALAGDAPQRRDLLGDGAAHARHRQIDAGTEHVAGKTRGVHEEADRGARARMGMHHRYRHRQHRF